MEELDEVFELVDDNLEKLEELIHDRLYQLIKIAQNNNYTDFGWKKPIPGDEDEDNDAFNEAQFNFILTDDFAYQTGEIIITRFMVKDNDIYGYEYYDDDDCELVQDKYIRFNCASDYNWRMGYCLIKMMEKELKEAGIAI